MFNQWLFPGFTLGLGAHRKWGYHGVCYWEWWPSLWVSGKANKTVQQKNLYFCGNNLCNLCNIVVWTLQYSKQSCWSNGCDWGWRNWFWGQHCSVLVSGHDNMGTSCFIATPLNCSPHLKAYAWAFVACPRTLCWPRRCRYILLNIWFEQLVF